MDSTEPWPRSPRELLLGSTKDFDASVDLDMVRRVGALAWFLSATLAALTTSVWRPTAELGSAGWVAAFICFGVLWLASAIGFRARRIALPVSMAVTLFDIVALGVVEWLDGPGAEVIILVTIPLVFVGASQAPRRVVLAVVAAVAAEFIPLAANGASAGALTVASLEGILWLVLMALALVWTAGVRWQRMALRDEERHASHLALHDPTTGLGNRRKLMVDLQEVFQRGQIATLALFDLNGFKAYNDSFGHPAGDSLLSRLGANLTRWCPEAGAYRMGGDEFCLLARGLQSRRIDLVAVGCRALSEQGPGFTISAAGGSVSIPGEAADPVSALRAADHRMYANKHERRGRAARDGAEMLLALQQERDASLAGHAKPVGWLSEQIAERVGLPEEERPLLRRALQLHDIGKLAIPDVILHKSEPLSDDDWGFIRRHTLVGQRIVGVSPDLVPVGHIIRSTHEWVDGSGYPDGLRGEEIPLCARIIAVCDAFQAMRSERPYRTRLSPDAILAELRHGAGAQFDSSVIDAALEILDTRPDLLEESSGAVEDAISRDEAAGQEPPDLDERFLPDPA